MIIYSFLPNFSFSFFPNLEWWQAYFCDNHTHKRQRRLRNRSGVVFVITSIIVTILLKSSYSTTVIQFIVVRGFILMLPPVAELQQCYRMVSNHSTKAVPAAIGLSSNGICPLRIMVMVTLGWYWCWCWASFFLLLLILLLAMLV